MVTTICHQRDKIISSHEWLNEFSGFGLRIFLSFWWILIWSKCWFVFLPHSRQTQQLHGNKKPNKILSPSGIHRRARYAASPLWVISVHVPDHIHWKLAHYLSHYLRLSPPYTNVLLPLQLVLCWHLFHLHYYPKNADKYTDTEPSYQLCRLPQPDSFFSLCLAAWTI